MFTPEMIEIFVKNTNSFAKTNRQRYWHDLTVAEFKTFMSICLYLGIVKYPAKTDAWSGNKFYGSSSVASIN